ncbi:DUF6165 family protein [Thioalkalivibrio sp. ALMg9]|uniref:DUF6165 family protein n=1 Tax=Thioalkalivibrio sp. ALMg9 TaxID=1266912 RepID=UPI00035E883B|nr:DUF6165 family protein [Thioalkalivibrio sp. ALMg9]
MKTISVPISPGELIDKITILEIKLAKITDEKKRSNVRHELEALTATWSGAMADEDAPDISDARERLKEVNEALWCIEDDIRECEADKAFGDRFIELARAVYFTNDKRAAIKRDINERLGSMLMEEKSYQSYS